jgi:parallel beta-helix repeat protein
MRRIVGPFRLAIAGMIAIAAASASAAPAPSVRVPAGTSLQRVLDAAAPGTTVILEPGVHRGPVTVPGPVTLQGSEGAILSAPREAEAVLFVSGDDVEVHDLTIRGGSSGIEAERPENLVIEDVAVRGSDLHGIHIAGGSADIIGADVAGLRHPFAQGIEVFDAPGSRVRDSKLSGGREGIVTHLSHRMVVEGNTVTDTSFRGIAIKEMSHSSVTGNTVLNARGMGFYCGDMSMCAFSANRATSVAAGEGTPASAGWGLVVHYHAVASSHDDLLSGDAGALTTFAEGRIVESSPLELGSGLQALWKTLGMTLVGLLLLLGLYLAARPLTRRLFPLDAAKARRVSTTAIPAALAVGLVIQTFHMGEHFVQVFRVHFDGVPSKGGIVGSVVDTEWVHFTYNLAVLIGLVAVIAARFRGWLPRGRPDIGDGLLTVATLMQSYHVVEHSVKLTQHLVTGAKVNPGILGGPIDLVWLHFVINLAVYAGFAGALLAYQWWRPRPASESSESPAFLLQPARH